MNRSTLMIAIFVGFGVLSFVGCGDTENSKSERSSSSQAESDNIELNVGTDKIEFAVQPPSDSEEGIALRSLMPDAKPPVAVQPEPIEPPTELDSRITITCRNEEVRPMENQKDSDSIRPLHSSFTIGLEETSRDGTVGYESRTFSYACGKEGAFVSIAKLSAKSKYKLDATYTNHRGIATHKGEASFQISQGGSTSVKLHMKKIKSRVDSVNVDIIFDDDKKPVSCKEANTVCTEEYSPVVCEGVATPFDGREIALVIGPIKGGNRCEAEALLAAEACKQDALLMSEISCKPIK